MGDNNLNKKPPLRIIFVVKLEDITFEVPSIEEIYRYLTEIARKIRDNNISIDLIVGISRGGLIPARYLSDFLLIPEIKIVSAGFYLGPRQRMEKPIIYSPITENLSGKNVLLVDDVADTGETLIEVQKHIKEKGAKNIYTAVIYVKPWNKAKIDFYIKETNAWVIFPWERVETAKQIFKLRGRDKLQEILSSDKLYREVVSIFLSEEEK